MMSLQPLPSIIDFNQLFTAITKIKPFPTYSTVISLSRRLEFSGLRPDAYSVGSLVDAMELLKKMGKFRCSPGSMTYNTLIKGFLQFKDVKRALEILNLMISEGFAADNSTTSLFIELLCSNDISSEDRALLQKFFGK